MPTIRACALTFNDLSVMRLHRMSARIGSLCPAIYSVATRRILSARSIANAEIDEIESKCEPGDCDARDGQKDVPDLAPPMSSAVQREPGIPDGDDSTDRTEQSEHMQQPKPNICPAIEHDQIRETRLDQHAPAQQKSEIQQGCYAHEPVRDRLPPNQPERRAVAATDQRTGWPGDDREQQSAERHEQNGCDPGGGSRRWHRHEDLNAAHGIVAEESDSSVLDLRCEALLAVDFTPH